MKMKKFPMKFLTYWGILAVKVENKNIKKSVQKRAFTYKDWNEMLPLQVHTSTGATPPPSLRIQRGGRRSPVNRNSAEIQAGLNSKCMTVWSTISRKVETNFQQEGSVPADFKKPRALKSTIFPTRLQGQLVA